MIRYLTLGEVLQLHQMLIDQHGGARELRDLGALQSAIAQPRQAFSDVELYPTLADKAAALGFALVLNHPFVDGNKRIGHAAMAVFLHLNGLELDTPVEEAEDFMLRLAAGQCDREDLVAWIVAHSRPRS